MNIIAIPTKDLEVLNKIIQELQKYELNSAGEFITKNVQNLIYANEQDFNDKIQNIFKNIQRPFFLLNDHNVTFPIIKNLIKINQDSGVVLFDAHPDCDMNCKYDFFGDQNDILLGLIKKNIISPKNIVLVGIRKWTKDEYFFLKNSKIRYFDIKKIDEMGISELAETLMENIRIFKHFYLSIDMDVLDPGYAPGVQCPEPNGITPREFFYLLRRLKKLQNLVGIDLSEVNEKNDVNNITVKLAAKIISELG